MAFTSEDIKNIIRKNTTQKEYNDAKIDDINREIVNIDKNSFGYKCDMIHYKYLSEKISLLHVIFQFSDNETANSFITDKYERLTESTQHSSFGFNRNTIDINGGRKLEVFHNVLPIFKHAKIYVSIFRIGKYVHKLYISDPLSFIPDYKNIIEELINQLQTRY